jgi:hypothetical protein
MSVGGFDAMVHIPYVIAGIPEVLLLHFSKGPASESGYVRGCPTYPRIDPDRL